MQMYIFFKASVIVYSGRMSRLSLLALETSDLATGSVCLPKWLLRTSNSASSSLAPSEPIIVQNDSVCFSVFQLAYTLWSLVWSLHTFRQSWKRTSYKKWKDIHMCLVSLDKATNASTIPWLDHTIFCSCLIRYNCLAHKGPDKRF